MKIQIGDNIDIFYYIGDTKLTDQATITFIENDMIYTCGHCFPKNALTEYGTLVYSSGFDLPSEKEEMAVIKINKNKIPLFRYLNILNNFKYTENITTIMLNNRQTYQGFIISKIINKLKKGWQKINNNYSVNHQITKLAEPYYLVAVDNLIKNKGLSGSPWLVSQNNDIKLLGSHIGRTDGKENMNNIIEIVYVKSLNLSAKYF